MNRKWMVGLVGVVLVLGMVGMAGATPITDTVNGPATKMGDDDSYTIWHDFTDDGFSPGTVGLPGVDEILSASLKVYFYDDNDNQSEKFNIKLDGVLVGSQVTILSRSTSGSPFIYSWDFLTPFASLQPDGKLSVQISRREGDFYLQKSELTLTWEEYTDPNRGGGGGGNLAPVPEPTTMLLMGTGLLGIVSMARRRANRKN